MGHTPMFAHKDFADFCQKIGLASLGADDLELKKLAAIFWFTIEFGICKEGGSLKAYGAGLLSSMSEWKYCLSGKPQHLSLDPWEIARNHYDYPISAEQPCYFVAESFSNAKKQITDYCEQIRKPFNIAYDSSNHIVVVDREIKTIKEIEN